MSHPFARGALSRCSRSFHNIYDRVNDMRLVGIGITAR
jgi:hypothetical protein